MWQAVAQQISDVTGFPFSIKEKETLSGELNDCYCVGDGATARYFVKLNVKAHLSHFEAEAEALKQIKQTHSIITPNVIHVGTCKECAFIVLDYLPMRSLEPESAFYLGQQLAHMHQWGDQADFGFDSDNYIGTTIQPNSWQRKWCRFFSEQRIGWQLQLAKEKGYDFGDINMITENVHQRLCHHQPKPSLLHGDLWIGNCALSVDGPVIFDPASYWGDRECDIAMTELFSGFPEAFLNGYNSVWPLDKDYEERRDLYNLYHLLNHLNLFGEEYLGQVQRTFAKYTLT
ncbi:fructosamine kinase family protein [Thaumasiovibrio subtropicus]|uniref:fructosamine kinase family protein n=1 Tax=Thaumasiovibrio subtropicus TaxID=1891207 RepID=UPI000B3632B3|nr:fructosamine kinase family protein [Thaumasiovibrio subtropicus]